MKPSAHLCKKGYLHVSPPSPSSPFVTLIGMHSRYSVKYFARKRLKQIAEMNLKKKQWKRECLGEGGKGRGRGRKGKSGRKKTLKEIYKTEEKCQINKEWRLGTLNLSEKKIQNCNGDVVSDMFVQRRKECSVA